MMSKMFRFFLSFASLVICHAQSNPPNPPCNICGEGNEVGNPEAIFAYPGQPTVQCGILQSIGQGGTVLTEAMCIALPNVIGVCECQPIEDIPSLVTPIPVTPAPVTPAPVAVENPPCSVCGEGNEVGNPDAVFAVPDQPAIQCGLLERIGEDGGILTPAVCEALPPLIIGVCECRPIESVTPAPVAVENPPCSICGEGKEVGNPDAVFAYPNQKPFPCGQLEDIGEAGGLLTPDMCIALPNVIGVCDCQPIGSILETAVPVSPAPESPAPVTPAPVTAAPVTPAPVTPAPVTPAPVTPAPVTPAPVTPAPVTPAPVTPAPVTPAPESPAPGSPASESPAPVTAAPIVPITEAPVSDPTDAPTTSCSVCGEGNKVGNPDAIFSYPGQPEVTCGNLELSGKLGLISPNLCEQLPTVIGVCECEPITSAPVTSPPVTDAPAAPSSDPTTFSPVYVLPTFGPVYVIPTESPTGTPIKTFSPVYVLQTDSPTVSPISPTPTDEPTSEPTPAPVKPPVTRAPSNGQPMSCQEVPEGGCSVCGEGLCVTNYYDIFQKPGQPDSVCGFLELSGYNGEIGPFECASLGPVIEETCGCASEIPGTVGKFNPDKAPQEIGRSYFVASEGNMASSGGRGASELLFVSGVIASIVTFVMFS